MNTQLKLTFIMGTRPEVIKMAPIILEAKRRGLKTKIVFTNQHSVLAESQFKSFSISPDIIFTLKNESKNIVGLSTAILLELEKHKEEIKSNWIIVQGDTTSALMAAYWAFTHQIPIAYIESGLRTRMLSETFPEEANRQMISRLANLHFVPTQTARENLLKEKINLENTYLVGNTGIDSLMIAKSIISKNNEAYPPSSLSKIFHSTIYKKIVFVTVHRRENLGKNLENICHAIKDLSTTTPNLCFIFPVHLNPAIQKTVLPILFQTANVLLTEPFSYLDCISVLLKTHLILTDSGGLQEEAPYLKIPVLVLRRDTERSEGIKSGFAKICGTDIEQIKKSVNQTIVNDSNFSTNPLPYGDGLASQRILDVLIHGKCEELIQY